LCALLLRDFKGINWIGLNGCRDAIHETDEERAASPGCPIHGGGGFGDKLILHGQQFPVFHGVKQEKQTLRQKFVVNIDNLVVAGESDCIADTVSYTYI